MAIRELLQNAIDACNYRKTHIVNNTVYEPEVTITLLENKLVIEDNGIGMNEHIIEEYFTKLCKSYYQDFSVNQSIGKFGVGVFSYFLLCECFDVESLKEDFNPLKFQVTNNHNAYFYFFANKEKATIGTKITLFLNKDVSEELTLELLYEKVRHFIRYNTFPIILKSNKKTITIESQNFKINKKEEIENKVKLEHQEAFLQHELVDFYISNERFEGIMSILFNKNAISGSWSYYSQTKGFLEVSLKGIFVGSTDSKSFPRMTGHLNLKSSEAINLSRTGFQSNNLLNEILAEFECEVMKKCFNKFKNSTSPNSQIEEWWQYSKAFINSHVINPQYLLDTHIEVILEYFVFHYYYNNLEWFGTMEGIIKEYSQIIFTSQKDSLDNPYNKKFIYEISKKYNCPVIPIVVHESYFRITLEILKRLNHKKKVTVEKDISFIVFDLNKKGNFDNEKFKYDNLAIFDKKYLYTPTLLHDRFFNKNHTIIKAWAKYKSAKNPNVKVLNHYESFFSVVSDGFKHFPFFQKKTGMPFPIINLSRINKILDKVNKLTGKKHKVSKDDFPEWVHPHIRG